MLYEISRLLKNSDEDILVSSSNLGLILGVSQQTASRYLRKLEDEGLIQRVVKKQGQQISITNEGLSTLKKMYDELGFCIQGKKSIQMKGKVNIGLGEGAYYVKMYAGKIEKQLGFKPFYGTLNVKLEQIPPYLHKFTFKKIQRFEKDGRSFGEIKIVKTKLTSSKKTIKCYITLPERTHHKNELEIISKENLRKKLKLKDGSKVTLEVTN